VPGTTAPQVATVLLVADQLAALRADRHASNPSQTRIGLWALERAHAAQSVEVPDMGAKSTRSNTMHHVIRPIAAC
jgi:hypothetical protein